MKRFLAALLALMLATPAWAAPQWNVATVTGTGGQTGTYTSVAACDSTHFIAVARRASTLTSALTVYTVTGPGAITATDYTPSSPTTMALLMAYGCDATTILLGGHSDWIRSATISDPSTWTSVVNNNNASNAFTGYISKTSSDKTWRVWDICGNCSPSQLNRLLNFSIPWSVGSVAGSTLTADAIEQVSVSVASGYEASASVNYTSGQARYRGYSTGTSLLFTSAEPDASASGNSFWYQPFGMNGTLAAYTIKRANNSLLYVRWVNSSGTITELDTGSSTDIRPGCDYDFSGSQRRGWWVGAADGKLYKSNSISAPTSISNDPTYDMGSTALQSSTPVVMFCSQYNGSTVGVDINQDGTAGDPIVLLANKGIAYWGNAPAASGGPLVPQRAQRGPFNNLPFRGP